MTASRSPRCTIASPGLPPKAGAKASRLFGAAAVRAVRAVVARVRRIPRQPRLGERVLGFGDREVPRVLVQKCDVRYEIAGRDLTVLRIFHTREDRSFSGGS